MSVTVQQSVVLFTDTKISDCRAVTLLLFSVTLLLLYQFHDIIASRHFQVACFKKKKFSVIKMLFLTLSAQIQINTFEELPKMNLLIAVSSILQFSGPDTLF